MLAQTKRRHQTAWLDRVGIVDPLAQIRMTIWHHARRQCLAIHQVRQVRRIAPLGRCTTHSMAIHTRLRQKDPLARVASRAFNRRLRLISQPAVKIRGRLNHNPQKHIRMLRATSPS
jgi:hypothetical protein